MLIDYSFPSTLLAADALVSLGVVIAGLAILWTGERWIDPAVSIAIVLVIAWGTWGLLKDSVAMSLLAVPKTVSQSGGHAYLAGLPGVEAVHELIEVYLRGTTGLRMHTCHPRRLCPPAGLARSVI